MDTTTHTSDPDVARTLGVDASRKSGSKIRRVVMVSATAASIAVVLWLVVPRGGQAGLKFDSDAALQGDLVATISATGRLQGRNTVEIGAEVTGRVTRVFVDYNDHVKKGQILAEIDAEQLRSSVDEVRAQVAAADASIAQARATDLEATQNLARAREQATSGLVSRQELENAETSASRATATVSSASANAALARASLASAQSRLKKATIVAPQDGVVLLRSVEPGQTITAGYQTPIIFKLTDDWTHMSLVVDVDEADIGRTKEGQEATFTVDAYPGRKFASRVVTIRGNPRIVQNVVTYEAELAVENDDKSLRPGMTATATIVTNTVRSSLTVANAALRFSPPKASGPFSHFANAATLAVEDGTKRVWILAEGKPQPVVVKVGLTDGQRTQILSGAIVAGTRVITAASAEN